MLIRTPFLKGEDGYGSVPLTKENNRDVYRFWKNNIETDELLQRPPSSYGGWLRTWGQFARLCIAAKFVLPGDLVKDGSLFACFEEREFLECFLHYYRIRGRPGTVSSKAIQLNKMCTASYGYFMSVGRHQSAGRIKDNSAVSS